MSNVNLLLTNPLVQTKRNWPQQEKDKTVATIPHRFEFHTHNKKKPARQSIVKTHKFTSFQAKYFLFVLVFPAGDDILAHMHICILGHRDKERLKVILPPKPAYYRPVTVGPFRLQSNFEIHKISEQYQSYKSWIFNGQFACQTVKIYAQWRHQQKRLVIEKTTKSRLPFSLSVFASRSGLLYQPITHFIQMHYAGYWCNLCLFSVLFFRHEIWEFWAIKGELFYP